MTKTLLDKIRKKVHKKLDTTNVGKEIQHLQSSFPQVSPGYRPHRVKVDGESFTAYDAKAINKYLSQTGRGDYRYLSHQGIIEGLAVHRNNGNYRRVV